MIAAPSAVPHPRRLVDEAVGWAAVGVLSIGGASMAGQRIVGSGGCALRAALGIPCPTCGLSTLVAHAAHLDVAGALRLDAVGVALLALLGALAVLQLVHAVAPSVRVPTIGRWWIVLPALSAVHWCLTLAGVVHLDPLGA